MAHTQKQIGEKDIHNREAEGVKSLIPFQLRENSATLIALLEDYYTHLNLKDNPTNLIDRIQFEHDIDLVDDKYLNEIKNEIAKGVPDSTVLTNRQLFRKIVEYYYTRGSQNSAEVFFKLFFDDNITLTYPKETLLKPSDGAIREYGFVENTSAKVPYSTVSGDFITPKDISAPAGMLPVRVNNSIMPDGVTDAYWINGLYTFNRTTQRFEKDANNYFYFNTTLGRWYYQRNEDTFRYAYDTSGASQTDGFWSIPSGSWEGYISSTATDLGVTDGTGGFQFPYTDDQSKRSTDVEHNLNTATNRGRNKTTDTVLEHKENEGEYLISYGHLETTFWKYNKPATNTVVAYAYSWILNADGKPDSTTTTSFHPDYNSWHQAKAQLSYCGAKGQKMIQHSVTRDTGAGATVNITLNPADIFDETVVKEYSGITSSHGQIRLGTHDSNTTVYKKNENDNVSVFESPTSYPYSKAIGAPEQTILFADKGIGIEAQGKDHYVISLNAHGKEFSAINYRSTHEAVILGYALEDCEIEMWQIPLASSRYLGNRESIMQQGMRFEGPYADPVDYMIGTSTYFGGRKHHQWYEVVEPGNYASYTGTDGYLLRKINGVYKTLPIIERSKLLAGDRFLNTSSSSRGVNFLQGGLKVKRCATKTIRVKAGEKFSFIEEPTSSMPYYHAFYLKSTGNIVASITQENETEDNYQIMPTTDKAIIRGDGYELSVDGIGSISGAKITSAALGADGYVTINHSLSTRHSLLTGQYVNIRDLKAADGTTNFSKLTSGTYNGMSTDPNGLHGPIEWIDYHSFKYPLFKTYFNSKSNGTGNLLEPADQTSLFFPGMKVRSPYLSHPDRQADPAIYASQTFVTALVNGSSGFSTGAGNNITIDNQHGTARVGMFVHTDDFVELSTGKILYGAGQGNAKETGIVVATGTNTIQIAPYTFTATTVSAGTSGATVVTNITSNYDFPLQGMTVTGTNVPAGTIVVAPSTNAQALNTSSRHAITMSNSASPADIPNNTTLTFSTVLPATLPNNRLLKFSTPVLQDQTITSMPNTSVMRLSKTSGNSSASAFTYNINFPYVAEGGLPTGLSAVSYAVSTDSDSPSISEAVAAVARINNTYIDNRGNEERPIKKRQNVFAFDPGDGAGGDATSHIPLKMCKDTYVIPHKISDWSAITSYTNKWVVSYWRSDNVVPGNNKWVVFESVSRPNTADNAVQLQYKPAKASGGQASGEDAHFAISSLQTIGTLGSASVVDGKQIIEFAGGSRTGTIRVGQRLTQALTSAKSVGAQNKTAGQQVLIDGISAAREVVVGQRVQGTGISGTVLIATIVTQSGQAATITLNGNINVANDADLTFSTMGIDNDVYVTKTFQPQLGNDLPSGFASGYNTFEVSEAVTIGVGTDLELKTEPNLWKFEAINPFALYANDESDDEELYYGFNRNTYNKAVYSFYSDYDDRKGFVSDQNKVHDGDFNQEYSYGVNTSISLDKWEPQYKKLVHPSGTKMFGLLRLEAPALKLTETAYDGGSTYDLSDGSWINNLHLPVGQHTPYYQPGWLDEITSAEVLISPFETFGSAAFNSVPRSTHVGQRLNSSYTLTAPQANGALTEIKLVTTNVCTSTPITISTLNLVPGQFLKTMPRLTSRNLALSQFGIVSQTSKLAIPETGGNGNWQVSSLLTSGSQRYIGSIKNFIDNHTDTGNNFSAAHVFSDNDPDWRNANNDDQIISLGLNINANSSGFKQSQIRIYGLISGRKYKVTGEWRLVHNTITSGAAVNVGLDINDGYVDENNSSTTITHDAVESNTVYNGSTTSFASYEITGTYSNGSANINGGRLNVTGTHNFVDLRLAVDNSSGTYSGKAVAQFKNFKIEEYYGEENTSVFSSVFDTAVPANSNDSDTNRTDRLTNFTAWSTPMSGLASGSIIPSDGVEYTVFDLPYGASCKVSAGDVSGFCSPIALDGKHIRDNTRLHGSQLTDAFSGSEVRTSPSAISATFNFNV